MRKTLASLDNTSKCRQTLVGELKAITNQLGVPHRHSQHGASFITLLSFSKLPEKRTTQTAMASGEKSFAETEVQKFLIKPILLPTQSVNARETRKA